MALQSEILWAKAVMERACAGGGTILVRDGRIAAIGDDLARLRDGARRDGRSFSSRRGGALASPALPMKTYARD